MRIRAAIAYSLLMTVGLLSFPELAAAKSVLAADSVFTPFRPPSGKIECEFRVGKSTDPLATAFVLSYTDGEQLVNQRLIDIGYGQNGNPQWISVTADESDVKPGPIQKARQWSVLTHGFFIAFNAPDAAWGVHVLGVRPDEPRSSMLRRGKPVSSAVTNDARSLSIWFWASRCGRIRS